MATVIRQTLQLGNLVRTRRKELGLTQDKLADKAGLRQSTISSIETGSKATRIDTILRVIAMLDLDLVASPRQRSSVVDFL